MPYVSPYAFGMHRSSHNETPFHDLGFKSFNLHAGATTWITMEREKGELNTNTMPQRVSDARAIGCELLLHLDQPPAWATGDEQSEGAGPANNAFPPDNVSDFTDYIELVDDGFPEIGAYCVWNEPNSSSSYIGTKAQLRDLHTAAYDVLNPRGKLLVSACPSDNGALGIGTDYLFDYLTPEVIAKTDVIGFHNYVFPMEPEALILSLRHTKAVLRRLGAGHLPIWNTEWTWHTWRDENGDVQTDPMPESRGAAYIVRGMLANIIGGAERQFYYGLDFDWSVIRVIDLDDKDTILEPGIAYRHAAQLLAGATTDRFRQKPPLYTYDWSGPTSAGRIFWCADDETATVDLSRFSSGVDVLGEPITLSDSYEVGMSPIFVSV